MSTMQVFYTDLIKVTLLGEKTVEVPTRKLNPPTAVDSDSYQHMLAQLTQVTLAELNHLKSEMAWPSWWE